MKKRPAPSKKNTAQKAEVPTAPPPKVSPTPAASTIDWKQHPIAIAVVCVTGTIAFCGLVVKEWILPTYTKSLENQIAELRVNVDGKSPARQALSDQVDRLNKELAEEKKRNAKIFLELYELQSGKLFDGGILLPMGLRDLKPGDLATRILEVFPDAKKADDDHEYFSVDVKHKIFSRAVYYYSGPEKNKRITHISFSPEILKAKDLMPKVKEMLVTAAGKPNMDRRGRSAWVGKSSYNAFLSDLSLIVSQRDIVMPWYDASVSK